MKKHSIILSIGLLLTIVAWQFRMRFPFDDTFITFRYAQHLAAGLGFVWNVGGPHTEGYTNFLYIVLLAPAFLLNLEPLIYAQVLNLAALVGSALLIFLLSDLILKKELHAENSFFSLFAAVLFLLTPLVWINALSGMETTLFGFGVLFTIYNFAKGFYALNGQSEIRIAFATAFLTALIRPEGALLGAILWFVLFLDGRDRVETSTNFILFCAFPLFLYHATRYFYFGSLLPNSFLVKVVDANLNSNTIFHGIQYVRIFLTSTLALVLASLFVRRSWRSWKVLWAVVLWSVAILFFYTLPFPTMGLYDRFLYSVEVALFVLAAVGLHLLTKRRGKVVTAIILMVFLALHANRSWLAPRPLEARMSSDLTYIRYREIAQILKEIPEHDSISFAFADAGIIPFYSGLQHLDFVGLNDNAIARARSAENVITILSSRKPDMIFLPLALQGPDDDSCRRIYRFGHGFIGGHYASLMQDPRFSDYKVIVLFHVDLYDVAVLSNIHSVHARSIEAAFRSRMPSKLILIAPECLD